MLARRARLQSRTSLQRKTRLRARKPMRRSGTKGQFAKMRKLNPRRSTHRRVPEGYRDPDYLAWLEKQPGRSPEGLTPPPSIAHHLRHTETGAPMGAHIKDDSRAIPLSWENHGHIHGLTGPFKGWTREQVQAWENEQLAQQRAEFFRKNRGSGDLSTCEDDTAD